MDKYISIKVILDDILEHPMLKDMSFERAINHTIHFMRIVGCPNIFIEKSDIVHIENYRGSMPDDFDEIIQIRTNTDNSGDYKVLRHTTDNFHMSDNKQYSLEPTYKVQGNVIFTSFKDGDVEIMYRAILVDDEGLPLIPDNSSFIRALELYIKKKYFTVLFDLGKITPAVYNNVLQEYAWAVGQAQSDLVRPSLDQMQSITNSLHSLIPKSNMHDTGFINNGNKY